MGIVLVASCFRRCALHASVVKCWFVTDTHSLSMCWAGELILLLSDRAMLQASPGSLSLTPSQPAARRATNSARGSISQSRRSTGVSILSQLQHLEVKQPDRRSSVLSAGSRLSGSSHPPDSSNGIRRVSKCASDTVLYQQQALMEATRKLCVKKSGSFIGTLGAGGNSSVAVRTPVGPAQEDSTVDVMPTWNYSVVALTSCTCLEIQRSDLRLCVHTCAHIYVWAHHANGIVCVGLWTLRVRMWS